MKQYSHTQTTTATVQAIWKQWSQPELWVNQNTLLKSATLQGSFTPGSTIVLEPKKGPKSTVVITEATINKSFTAESKLPLALLQIKHEITEQTADKLLFTHTMTVTGPLASLFCLLFVETMAKQLPAMTENIAKFAEADQLH